MYPSEMRDARSAIGAKWGLGRALRKSELAEVLGFHGRDPGQQIANYENGITPIKGPVELAVKAMLAGYRPPNYPEWLKKLKISY